MSLITSLVKFATLLVTLKLKADMLKLLKKHEWDIFDVFYVIEESVKIS